jgi:putative peptidoglycan lipid II flippase
MRLCDFPQGIFVLALQAATLPSLSKLVAEKELDEVAKTYAFGMRLTLFVAIPATALFVALSRPLVVAIFERGAFDSASSAETARALVAQGLGIWTVAATRQLLPVFYAMGDVRMPVVVSALDLAAFIVAAVTLKGPLGHVGISVAVSVSSAIQMLLLWFGLRLRLPSLRLGEIGVSAARTAVASLVATAAGYALATASERLGLGRVLPGALGGLAFALAFVASTWALRSPELAAITGPLRRRLGAAR